MYGSGGELIRDINIPVLKAGDNELEFNCESEEAAAPRLQVTVISEGLPLENVRNEQKINE